MRHPRMSEQLRDVGRWTNREAELRSGSFPSRNLGTRKTIDFNTMWFCRRRLVIKAESYLQPDGPEQFEHDGTTF